MSQELLAESLPLGSLPVSVKRNQTPTTLQAVSSHLQFIHSVNVLDVTFHTGAIGTTRDPQVEVLVTTSLEV